MGVTASRGSVVACVHRASIIELFRATCGIIRRCLGRDSGATFLVASALAAARPEPKAPRKVMRRGPSSRPQVTLGAAGTSTLAVRPVLAEYRGCGGCWPWLRFRIGRFSTEENEQRKAELCKEAAEAARRRPRRRRAVRASVRLEARPVLAWRTAVVRAASDATGASRAACPAAPRVRAATAVGGPA